MRRFLLIAAAAVALPAAAALPLPADELVGTWECRIPGAPRPGRRRSSGSARRRRAAK